MIRIEKDSIYGLEEAIRGMRNPMNSWNRSDSIKCSPNCDCVGTCNNCMGNICIGDNDRKLMLNLRKAGTDHRKFMRMITVYVDITAPLYWWKEFDTYKVGTVANSCSTMHKIAAKPFEVSDFSVEHLMVDTDDNDCPMLQDPNDMENAFNPQNIFMLTLRMLNACRVKYLVALKTEKETGFPAKDIWWQMIQLLPSSYNQKRTVMLNYEVLTNIYKSRKNHKLDEWRTLCEWIEGLPYSELICWSEDEKPENNAK